MELADDSLSSRIEREIPSDSELLQCIEDAASAIDFLNRDLHHIHRPETAYVRHRDIKPSNLLLFGTRGKIADYSLIRVTEHTETTHTGHCTPAYAAPEMIERHRLHRNSDQYSLAVTYWAARTKKRPSDVDAADRCRFLSDPEHLSFARATSRDPDARYPTCRQFVRALREALLTADHSTEAKGILHHTHERLAAYIATVSQALHPIPYPSLSGQ